MGSRKARDKKVRLLLVCLNVMYVCVWDWLVFMLFPPLLVTNHFVLVRYDIGVILKHLSSLI